jgi:LemA protein
MIAAIVLLVLVVGLIAWVVGLYNRLVALRNRFKNAFAQIDVQLKRRYDLIPNLVETAKGYLQHERATLEAVIAARNQAVSAAGRAGQNPGDPESMKQLSGAESVLTGALTRFFALAEAYPDLKANQTMASLMEELTSTENRIAFSRQGFNDAVMAYNTGRETFPTMIIANSMGFQPAQLLEATSRTEEREPVRVSFTS